MTGETYRAVLRGNRVEWIGQAPSLEGDTRVVITFLEAEQNGDAAAAGTEDPSGLHTSESNQP